MATLDDLWGGRLAALKFDPVSHACELQVTTLVNSRTNSYVLECKGVTDLRFHNAIPEPWIYAEVTEAHLSVDEQSGQYVLELILWSEDADFVVRCSSIEVREATR